MSVIPTDPTWQPTTPGAAAAAQVFRGLAPNADRFDVDYYHQVRVVDAGENLVHIGCPVCGLDIDLDWFRDLTEIALYHDGFHDLNVTVPCCGGRASLNDLDYDWPVGFARFELAAWEPERDQLTAGELAQIAQVLGHDVRQIMTHI